MLKNFAKSTYFLVIDWIFLELDLEYQEVITFCQR